MLWCIFRLEIYGRKTMINLHLGDCMTAMAEMPDKCFDLAICDPPYQVKMTGGKSPKNGFKGIEAWDKMRTGWDKQRPKKDYFESLFRISKNQIITGGNYFTEFLPSSMGWVFWYKLQDNFSFGDGEFIFTSFHKKARIFKYGRGCESGFAPNGEPFPNIHPTQKPVALYRWLLDNYAKPGDKIFDSHLGSGSIAIACHDLGFDLEGYEIDPDYYAAACDRFQRYQAQGRLF